MTVDTPYASVRQATETERQVALDVLVEAFADDPVAAWLFPDPGERAHHLAAFHRPLVAAGETYLTGRGEGAAVWLAVAEGRSPYEGAPEVGGARLRALGEALTERHPAHAAHLYLPCMGVVAARQGTGLGSALLRHRLTRADTDGVPAYLEASSPRSRALYLRHGFTDLGEPVRVADSPPLCPMWREPEGKKR
jgi:GNAT superfamily N-acetyltransferase